MSNDFILEFAGVPFVTDKAADVPLPGDGKGPPVGVGKYQSCPDLLDEIDRLIPFHYTSDLCYPDGYPGRTLGGLAGANTCRQDPVADIRIGQWYYPPRASRWSVFRGLMTSSMVAAVRTATTGFTVPQPFVVTCSPGAVDLRRTNTVETNLYCLPPRPISDQGPGFEGLYLVTLVDERFYFAGSPVSLQIGRTTTWSDLLTQLASALGITLTLPAIPSAYQDGPEGDSQLWTSFDMAATLLDAVCDNLGVTLVRNLDGTYKCLTPVQSKAIIDANRGDARKVVKVAGGDMFASGTYLKVGDLTAARNSVVPSVINVTFPKYVTGNDPVPHFVNPRTTPPGVTSWFEESYGDAYLVQVPITSGGPRVSGLIGVSNQTVRSTAKALLATEGASPSNATALTTLALQIAQDRYDAQAAAALDEVYPGIVPWVPEGINSVVWTYSSRLRLASTRVVRPAWTDAVTDSQHRTPNVSGFNGFVGGAGGPRVAQTIRTDPQGAGVVAGGTTLAAPLVSGGMFMTVAHVDRLPTQNRWRAKVDGEVMLMEGTLGGQFPPGPYGVAVVYRGLDGTNETTHVSGSVVARVWPDTAFGANLITHEKGSFVFPSDWTAGGVTGANVVPQTQSIQVLDSTGCFLGGQRVFSGLLWTYDTTGGGWTTQENVWAIERNGATPTAGQLYDGQFATFSLGTASGSALGSGGVVISGGVKTAPIYLINTFPAASSGGNTSGLASGGPRGGGDCLPVPFNETDVRCEGGYLNVYQRTVLLSFSGGCLMQQRSPWYYAHGAGCCSCSGTVTSGGPTSGGGNCVTGQCSGLCTDSPYQWQVPVDGFTGNCQIFNRTWKLAGAGTCTWLEGISGGTGTATGTLVLNSGTAQFDLAYAGTFGATYTGLFNSGNCCQTISLSLRSGSCGCATSANATCLSCDYSPGYWTIPLGGFTGCFSLFNVGTKQLNLGATNCLWDYSQNNLSGQVSITASLSLAGTDAQLSLLIPLSGSFATYQLTGGVVNRNCCGPFQMVLTQAQCIGVMDGTLPPTMVMTPSCASPPPGGGGCTQNLTAIPSCCSGTYSGSVSSGGTISGGGGGSVSVGCCSGVFLPGTLFATFGGDLAGMGTQTVTWNGSVWNGTANNTCGNNIFSFQCVSSGDLSGIAFCFSMSGDTNVAEGGSCGAQTTSSPFLWGPYGTAPVGFCGGMGATITVTQ